MTAIIAVVVAYVVGRAQQYLKDERRGLGPRRDPGDQ
jgi:hypothetical protein